MTITKRLAGVFDRARLRVNDMTKGAEVAWYASKVETPLVFFERASDAPPPAVSSEQEAAIRARPIRDLGAQEAYAAALERDTLDGLEVLIPILYLKGISTGDFEDALIALLGRDASGLGRRALCPPPSPLGAKRLG